jgi:hypothetical protein
MKLEDFKGTADVNSEPELESFLKRRFGECVNEFWLSHGNKEPVLAIMVNGQLAVLHYFPKRRHAGFRSLGKIDGLDPQEMSIFFTQTAQQKLSVLNSAIVPFDTALKIAREFLHAPERPSCVDWLEL